MTCKLSDECWCSECHTSRLAVHQLKDVLTLKRDFDKAVRDEDKALNDKFAATMKTIAIAKAFRLAMLTEGKKQVKRFLVSRFGLDADIAKKKAKSINCAVSVYNSLKKIADNIWTCGGIDIRQLSIPILLLCRNLNYCYRYQALTKTEFGDRPAAMQYEEDHYTAFLNMAKQHDLFKSEGLQGDQRAMAAVLARFSKDILKGN